MPLWLSRSSEACAGWGHELQSVLGSGVRVQGDTHAGRGRSLVISTVEGMTTSACVISASPPLCQGDQYLQSAHRGYTPHSYRHVNCTDDVSTEPSAVTPPSPPKHSGSSEPLKPGAVIAQRPTCTSSLPCSHGTSSLSTLGPAAPRCQSQHTGPRCAAVPAPSSLDCEFLETEFVVIFFS